jgi:hypothetical protein
MFSSWDAGCRHFFHLVDRVSQARTCALAGDKETLNFAKVGLARESISHHSCSRSVCPMESSSGSSVDAGLASTH